MSDCHGDGGVATLDSDAASKVDARVALVGSPNAGKTTLFNALTGARSKTANYPGVTVTRREGQFEHNGRTVALTDLPGTYSLTPISPDEQIVIDSLEGRVAGVAQPDGLICVVDATTLERSLFLVGETLALDLPTLVVVTMLDELVARGGALDIERLSAALGVPVVGIVGHKGIGVSDVADLIVDPSAWSRPVIIPPSEPVARSGWVASIIREAVTLPGPDRRSVRIDRVLLNPVWGTLVFVVVMLLFFQAIFTLAAPAADLIDRFVSWLGGQASELLPGQLGAFVADGVIGGVGGVLVFIPQIAVLFVMLALLDKCGYLARAALLADRVMGRFGLEGRSFVAMLSSFACAIPGIMATRTIADQRARIATMMAAPLMTCSARLPVYTLLVSGFVPDRAVFGPIRSQGLVMFGLYALGAVSGLLYAGILHLTSLRGSAISFVMELPPYRMPTIRSVAWQTFDGVWSFVRKAGTIIFATTAVLWLLLNVPRVDPPAGLSGPEAASYQMEHSVAGWAGHAITPLTDPLGFDWRINVSLIGSMAAREVFVSTLAVTTAAQDEATVADRAASLTNSDGEKLFNAATVAALLVFFVYALQCFSTIAVLRRETNSWRWPLLAAGSMFAVAYVGALIAHTVVGALS